MKSLTELLMEYRDLTIKLSDKIYKEEYDEDISDFFNRRGNIIEEIKKENYDSKEFRNTFESLKLSDEEKKLEHAISLKKTEVEKSIVELRGGKSARSTYGKKFSVGPFYVSKKI
ncbi:hypothetical protein NL50_02245 [Clostridium acetobutylicum]|nr:hypothetical protein NL50_02245 [Clostridium acetobutylicum]